MQRDLILYGVCLMDFVEERGQFDHVNQRLVVPCGDSFYEQLRFFHEFFKKNGFHFLKGCINKFIKCGCEVFSLNKVKKFENELILQPTFTYEDILSLFKLQCQQL